MMAALLINLEFAIYAGVLLSLVIFLSRSARPFIGVGAPNPSKSARTFAPAAAYGLAECPQFMIARLDGPLYFGSCEHIRREFRAFEVNRPGQKHILFIAKGIGDIDLPAADLLIEESRRRRLRGGSFHLHTKSPRSMAKLDKYRVTTTLTKDHVHVSKSDAIARVVPVLDPEICKTCTKRIFQECQTRPGGTEAEAGN